MEQKSKAALLSAFAGLMFSGVPAMRAQERAELPVEHAECVFFGAKHDKFAFTGLHARSRPDFALSSLTTRVTRGYGWRDQAAPAGATRNAADAGNRAGTIDSYLFQAMRDAGVTPADTTNDFEFIRRVTLDLTGRIPTPERVLSFVADTSTDKRAKLVDELLNKSEWVDKWTMYFGDLFKNVDRTTQINRYEQGRNAFYLWINDSIAANKPYDQMARELISGQGQNSWDPKQGAINWMVGGLVTGGPASGQDNFDQQAADIATTFLGLANMNCLLCHNGRGHLDSLNLWASKFTRYQAWQFASFLSHTSAVRQPPPDPNARIYYYAVQDDTRFKTDYPLNTTTGNRPARQPVGNIRNVAPVYPFSNNGPKGSEDYRAALAREITSDFQFARASVNYIWKEFFGRGIVDPADQFDLARLDPDNPPPDPWTLQPSNPRLLNAFAQDFIDSKFDLKALMREIVNSQAYQLSSRYSGDWNPAWEPLFARKLVRRLWAEEIHDAIAQSSNVIPSYPVNMSTSATPDMVKLSWAMQLPQTSRLPGGAVTTFLDNFLRGNRDDQERKSEGSILESLSLKNDAFVMGRIRATGHGPTGSLLAQNLDKADDQLINNLFLAVLSRFPSDAEMGAALDNLHSGDRTQAAENLLWTLYNKIDFVFNY